MTLLWFAFLVAIGCAIGAVREWMRCERVLDRAIKYARARADYTERGCAYSDMATAIVIDDGSKGFKHRPPSKEPP